MSKTDVFWQYANEAILSASRAETEGERHGLLDLARTGTQAALVERHFTPGYRIGGVSVRRKRLMPSLIN
jgi:hypothetical protein